MENGRRSEEQMDSEPLCNIYNWNHSITLIRGFILHSVKSCCYHIWDLQVWTDCKTAALGPRGPVAQLYVEKDYSSPQTSSSMSQYKSKSRNVSLF